MKRNVFLAAITIVLFACVAVAPAQNAGYDLFQTGTGTSVDLTSIGVGVVQLQGVPIQGAPGNSDTMIQRTQSVPTGGGTVPVSVYALSMKSTNSVTFQGQPADVYVTINNTGGMISTGVLPQPDSLSASGGSLNVRTDGTFDSSITVNADLIFVKAGTSVTSSANWLGHQPASSTTLSSTNSTWSTSAPAGYPSSTTYASGGFYPINVGGGGHSTPTHVHGIVPAQNTGTCKSPSTTATVSPSGKSGTKNKGTQQQQSATTNNMVICYE
jgi:hypothetical protein